MADIYFFFQVFVFILPSLCAPQALALLLIFFFIHRFRSLAPFFFLEKAKSLFVGQFCWGRLHRKLKEEGGAENVLRAFNCERSGKERGAVGGEIYSVRPFYVGLL